VCEDPWLFFEPKGVRELWETAVTETYFVLVTPEEISVLKITLFRILTMCSLVEEHAGFFITIEDVRSVFPRDARIFVPDYTVSHRNIVLSTYSPWFQTI